MTFRSFLLSISLLSIFPNVCIVASTKNLCDDMVASGNSSESQIAKCIAKFGESDFYKEQIKKKKWQLEIDAAKTSAESARKANIEARKFTSAELDEAGFGKPFFAIRIDYSNQNNPKVTRITEGDALCSFLGYEKVLKSIVSDEITPSNASKNGFFINTNFLGMISKEPEMYVDKNEIYNVRKYVEITCAKVRSKDVNGTAAELEKVTEDLIVLNDMMNSPQEGSSKGVNDGSRTSGSAAKSPKGYERPEWATDLSDTLSK